MTALPGETGVKGTGEVGDPSCATNPELLNPGLGFAECVRDLEALVVLRSHNTMPSPSLHTRDSHCKSILKHPGQDGLVRNGCAKSILSGVCVSSCFLLEE